MSSAIFPGFGVQTSDASFVVNFKLFELFIVLLFVNIKLCCEHFTLASRQSVFSEIE